MIEQLNNNFEKNKSQELKIYESLHKFKNFKYYPDGYSMFEVV